MELQKNLKATSPARKMAPNFLLLSNAGGVSVSEDALTAHRHRIKSLRQNGLGGDLKVNLSQRTTWSQAPYNRLSARKASSIASGL